MLKHKFEFEPKVIYDIGAAVLHWSRVAKTIWPKSKLYAFDATSSVEFLYVENALEYHIGALSDADGREVTFYQNDMYLGGNSYYPETNTMNYRPVVMRTSRLDTVVKDRGFQLPDLIKIDVQGAEVDVLKGMTQTLKSCQHLIVELQHEQYNRGAMLSAESVPFIESLGFKLVKPLFCNNGPDGDYHFQRINYEYDK